LRRLLRRAVAGLDGRLHPRRREDRRRHLRAAHAVVRHRRARLRLPAHGRGRRRRAHPLDLRVRVGGPARAGAVRAHDGRRRVRRRHPDRTVRDHWRRLDRARHRRDPARLPQARRHHGQPRPPHARQGRPRRRQGRGHVRGRRPLGAHRAPARRPRADRAAPRRRALRALPERLRAEARRAGGSTVKNPFEGRQIWFLTGSQDLYGEETLAQVATQSREVAAHLQGADDVPVEIVWKPVLKDAAAIRRVALEANADDSCIGVVVWMHTFSPAKMWITGLEALQTPLLHLHTQANVELPWAEIDMDFMNLNQAAHGDREFGYVAARLGVPRKIVVGHASTPHVQAQVGRWARAAAGWAALRGATLARFGDNMRFVAVTEGDKTEAEVRFGVAVNTWGVNELVERVDAAAPEQIDALVGEYEELYDVVPELRSGGGEVGATAFTTTFEDLGGLRQLPGLAVQRLMADGYGFGAEGDWKTALLVRAAKVMGHGLPGGASLMEDYTYELTPGKEKI